VLLFLSLLIDIVQ